MAVALPTSGLGCGLAQPPHPPWFTSVFREQSGLQVLRLPGLPFTLWTRRQTSWEGSGPGHSTPSVQELELECMFRVG